jgi:hypothetical protein
MTNRSQLQIELEASCFMHEVFSYNELQRLNRIEKQNKPQED